MIAFFQKYLVYALLAVIEVSFLFGGIQYIRLKSQQTTIAKNEATILDLKKTNADLQGQVADYKKNIAAMKKAQREQQIIADNTATLLAQAQQITANCLIGGKDEKTIDGISLYFNNGGVLNGTGDSKTNGKVLPASGAPDPGNPVKQRYSVKQIIENYLTVIDYTLKLEKTVNCYEK